MKKLLLLLLVPMLAFGIACGGDDDKDDNDGGVIDPGNGGDGGDGGATANVYYPMKTDAYWVMNYSDVENGSVVDQGEETLRITAKETLSGKEYWKFIDEDGDIDSYARISNNILYVFQSDFLAGKAAVAIAKAAGISQLPGVGGEIPLINFNTGAGKSWTIMDTSGADEGVNYSMKWTGTYVGTENVSVPAGTFSNCRKYRLNMLMSSTYNNFTYSSEMVTTVWLAANVGPVKTYEAEDYGEDEKYEYTTVLKSYSIP